MHWVSGLESNDFSPSFFGEVFFNLFWSPSEVLEVIMFWWAYNFNVSSNIIFFNICVDIDDFTMIWVSSINELSFLGFVWFIDIFNV